MSIDLGGFDFDGDMPSDDRPVDTSGKPHPTRAWAKCRDGNDIPIHIAYKGTQEAPPGHPFGNGQLRVYRLIIEGGWGKVIDRVHTIAIDNFATDIVVEFSDAHDTTSDKETIYRLLQRMRWHHLGDEPPPGMTVIPASFDPSTKKSTDDPA
jgi:hypothetical protein